MSGRHQPLNGATGCEIAEALAAIACVFLGCVSTDRHFHGPFPGGRENPADPDGPPIPFTSKPAPGVRDYNGALLRHDRLGEYRVTDETHWAANE